jgi:uncharacterized membrane protein YeaQ/YmgE (transglycosylase-associated protein family)
MLLNLILWIILGAIAGWIADRVVSGGGFGLIGNIIVGIVGAIVGGFLMNLLGAQGVTGFNLWSLLVATGGAILLLFVFSKLRTA